MIVVKYRDTPDKNFHTQSWMDDEWPSAQANYATAQDAWVEAQLILIAFGEELILLESHSGL